MTTVSAPRPPRQRKPLEPVSVRGHFIGGATLTDLVMGAAIVEIIDAREMASYWTEAVLDDDGRIVALRLRKFGSAEKYDLPADLSSCDCADRTYREERPGGCRHMVALRQALIAAADGLPRGAGKPATYPVA